MPAKKRPPKPSEAVDTPLERVLHALESQRALIEVIRSENRTTLEAVHTTHHRLSDQIRDIREQSEARFDTLERAVRGHSEEIRGLKVDVVSLKVDVVGLKTGVASLTTDVASLKTDVARIEAKVDRLGAVEERVAALERRGA